MNVAALEDRWYRESVARRDRAAYRVSRACGGPPLLRYEIARIGARISRMFPQTQAAFLGIGRTAVRAALEFDKARETVQRLLLEGQITHEQIQRLYLGWSTREPRPVYNVRQWPAD